MKIVCFIAVSRLCDIDNILIVFLQIHWKSEREIFLTFHQMAVELISMLKDRATVFPFSRLLPFFR